MTVATSRLISKIERENAPFQWWKGFFLEFNYFLLVFLNNFLSESLENFFHINFDFFLTGVMHVACRFSTFVFHPHAIGEILEFRILDIPYEYVDKCSALEKEYY
jgi:hypothetical protein